MRDTGYKYQPQKAVFRIRREVRSAHIGWVETATSYFLEQTTYSTANYFNMT